MTLPKIGRRCRVTFPDLQFQFLPGQFDAIGLAPVRCDQFQLHSRPDRPANEVDTLCQRSALHRIAVNLAHNQAVGDSRPRRRRAGNNLLNDEFVCLRVQPNQDAHADNFGNSQPLADSALLRWLMKVYDQSCRKQARCHDGDCNFSSLVHLNCSLRNIVTRIPRIFTDLFCANQCNPCLKTLDKIGRQAYSANQLENSGLDSICPIACWKFLG